MLTTTAKLLQRQGFHGTGLNQIVAEADAPKGSMYFHFPGGKQQLTAEAIALSGSYVETALADHTTTSAIASLDAYLADVANLLESSGYLDGCPIATVALEASASSDAIADACADAFERLTARVATWIASDGVDPVTARDRAFLVYAAIEGALMFAKAHKSIEPLTRLRAQLPLLLDVTNEE
jgi:TetR/AcrR family transcriptional regulator, lmrAB and yxaGH operons repressor